MLQVSTMTQANKPWGGSGVNTQLRGKPLLREMQKAIARLEAERVLIHEQDKFLLAEAQRLHDHHASHADNIRNDLINDTDGIGSAPALEDAYGQHLHDRYHADALVGHLSERIRSFVSKTDPGVSKKHLGLHAAAFPQEQQDSEDFEEETGSNINFDNGNEGLSTEDEEEN